LQWQTNRKSYVADQVATSPKNLSDHEVHFCCIKPAFPTPKTTGNIACINYNMLNM